MLKTLSFLHFWLRNVLRATTACTFSTLVRHRNLQKWSETVSFLTLLTWKCASRRNSVHFFDISTSKSGPRMVCFVHFDLEMCFAHLRATTACTFSTSQLPSGPDLVCFVHFDFKMCFAPQRRALFRHRNFQKWSGPGVFYTFWLQNVLRATTACNFSSLIWPAGSAPAALASLLFDPPEPQMFRDFPTFSHICIFFLLIFSLLTLLTSAFQLSILSEVSLLNFLRI